jgi:lysophospholipase L1-like esterase
LTRARLDARVTRRRLGIVLAAILVALVPLAWVSVAASRTEARPVARGDKVLVVGDSLTWQSAPQVTAALQADGWTPTIQAASGTTIGNWAGKVGKLVDEHDPDVLVVELGTNNCTASCPHIDRVIDRLLRDVPRSLPVVWLNVQAQPTYPAHPESVNDALAAAAARWPNVTLVDMSARFRNHPDWHVADGLHFTARGSAELGRLMAESLRAER